MFRDVTAWVLCSVDPFLFLPPHLVANYQTRNLKTCGIWPLKTEWISSVSTDGLKTLKKNIRNQIFVKIAFVKKVGKRSRGEKRGRTPFICHCKRKQVRNMTQSDIGASWKATRFREGLLQAKVTHHNLFFYSFHTRQCPLLATEHLSDESMMNLESWCLISSSSTWSSSALFTCNFWVTGHSLEVHKHLGTKKILKSWCSNISGSPIALNMPPGTKKVGK